VDAYVPAGFLAGVEAVYRLLGQADREAKDLDAARRDFQVAHLLGEALRDRVPLQDAGTTQAGFFARRAYVLDELVELELARGGARAAIGYAELAKARALQDVISTRTSFRTRPAEAILKDWPAGVAAVEYYLGREKAYAFTVGAGGLVKAVELDCGQFGGHPRLFLSAVQTFLHGIEGHSQRMLSRFLAGRGFDNSWQYDLAEFARVLLPPAVRHELAGATTVVLVPQNILHYFPFSALVLEKGEDPGPKAVARPKRFLADEPFVLVNAPSLAAWDALRRLSPRGPVIAEANAVGLVQAPNEPALPGVEADLNNLKEAFGARVRTVLSGPDATARRAARLFERPGLLLLATHGFNDAERPLESFLLLLPDDSSEGGAATDGRIRAGAVFQTRVTADVVVMSACYTGLGDRSPLPGDDLFGLQRAFLQAGARSVLAGLWDVYDGTAPELLGDCLRRLGAGEPVGAALAGSRKTFLAKYRASTKPEPYLHPYFWSVYTLLGDERPRVR
jgi:hypothetical protein